MITVSHKICFAESEDDGGGRWGGGGTISLINEVVGQLKFNQRIEQDFKSFARQDYYNYDHHDLRQVGLHHTNSLLSCPTIYLENVI